MKEQRKGVSTGLIFVGLGISLLLYLFAYPILVMAVVFNTENSKLEQLISATVYPLEILEQVVPVYAQYIDFVIGLFR